MPIKQPFLPILLFIALLINSCTRTHDPARIITDATGNITAVHLSSAEIKRAGVKYGSIAKHQIDKWIPCSGNLIVAPENRIIITAPAAGKIIAVYFTNDQYVKKGSKLASIENIDFIILQQEYLQAAYQFDYLREEYTRQGELTVENATSLKNMQLAKRDYQSAELRLYSLRSQLHFLGICPDSLKFDHLSPVIHIKAPCSGHISNTMILFGSYVEKGEMLFKLDYKQDLLAKLNVPEQYISFLQKGQLVNFWLQDSLSTFVAKISTIVREIDADSHSSIVYAELGEMKKQFVPGMSVKAKILADNEPAFFVNSHSIVNNPKGNYLFASVKGNYTRIFVKTGNTLGEMTEITGFSHEIADSVVVAGIEYLNTLFEH
jgi:cobalt-zinc-cadmium efflux system membrane fusion protein